MPHRIPLRALGALCVVAVLAAAGCADARAQTGPGRVGQSLTSVGATFLHQRDTALEQGGSFGVNAVLLRTGWTSRVGRGIVAGASLSIDGYDYDFDAPAAFGGVAPWGDVRRLGLGVPILRPSARGWTLFATPSVDVFRESGADSGDAVTWGAVLGGVYAVGPGRRVGIGVGLFDGLEETRGFPFLSVDWAFTDSLRLSNPLRAGPAGPAGLELAWTPGSAWELAAGLAWRSLRFRLDEAGLAPGGVGEQRGTPVFARASRQLGGGWRLDFYAGRSLNAELRLEDANGNRLVTAEHDDPGFIAATLRGFF